MYQKLSHSLSALMKFIPSLCFLSIIELLLPPPDTSFYFRFFISIQSDFIGSAINNCITKSVLVNYRSLNMTTRRVKAALMHLEQLFPSVPYGKALNVLHTFLPAYSQLAVSINLIAHHAGTISLFTPFVFPISRSSLSLSGTVVFV